MMYGILIVEDDLGDQKLIKAAISAAKQPVMVDSVSSAEEAVELLHLKVNEGKTESLPDLILLDLNMPGMGGREFLRRVKVDEVLRHIPIVVLTSSKAERDIVDSYRLQAAGYFHKPTSLLELKDLMAGAQHYWFGLCNLPQKEISSVG